MTRIKIGALQPGARALGIGITGARRGVADFTDGSRSGVIVKSCNQHELAAECFCALLAKDLGLNAPECGIVLEGGVWHFASLDVGYPNLLQAFNYVAIPPPMNKVLLALMIVNLSKWPSIGKLLSFDVLIKNADRNLGNLLTDGIDHWVIDHARAMDTCPYPNVQAIFTEMKQTLNANEIQAIRVKAISAALTYSPGCHTLSVTDLAAEPAIAPFAPNFDLLIAGRLQTLSPIVNSNL